MRTQPGVAEPRTARPPPPSTSRARPPTARRSWSAWSTGPTPRCWPSCRAAASPAATSGTPSPRAPATHLPGPRHPPGDRHQGPRGRERGQVAELAARSGQDGHVHARPGSDYQVPVSPYFVLADGPHRPSASARDRAPPGPRSSSLLEQACADAGLAPRRRPEPGRHGAPRRPGRGLNGPGRERRADDELRRAGIGPGHPSLYGRPADPTAGGDADAGRRRRADEPDAVTRLLGPRADRRRRRRLGRRDLRPVPPRRATGSLARQPTAAAAMPTATERPGAAAGRLRPARPRGATSAAGRSSSWGPQHLRVAVRARPRIGRHPLFASTGPPWPVAPDAFGPNRLQRPLPGQAGAQWFFTAQPAGPSACTSCSGSYRCGRAHPPRSTTLPTIRISLIRSSRPVGLTVRPVGAATDPMNEPIAWSWPSWSSPWPPPSARPGRRAGCRCCRPSPRWPSAAGATATGSPRAWFILGATLGGATLGLVAAGLAAGVHAAGVERRPRRLAVAAVAALVTAASDVRPFGRRLPFHRRQVNELWLGRYRPWVYASGFGWQIGTGAGHLHHDGGRVPAGRAGRPHRQPGRGLGSCTLFGLVRGLAVLLSVRITTPAALHDFHRRFDAARARGAARWSSACSSPSWPSRPAWRGAGRRRARGRHRRGGRRRRATRRAGAWTSRAEPRRTSTALERSATADRGLTAQSRSCIAAHIIGICSGSRAHAAGHLDADRRAGGSRHVERHLEVARPDRQQHRHAGRTGPAAPGQQAGGADQFGHAADVDDLGGPPAARRDQRLEHRRPDHVDDAAGGEEPGQQTRSPRPVVSRCPTRCAWPAPYRDVPDRPGAHNSGLVLKTYAGPADGSRVDLATKEAVANGRVAMPRAPARIEELGIPASLVQDLALRRALYEGRSSTLKLSSGLGLSVAIITTVVEELRDLRHIDLLGLEGRDYIFELTEQGRDTARERMELCRYAGIAPVSLKRLQRHGPGSQQSPPEVSRESMRVAFDDLVISDRHDRRARPGSAHRRRHVPLRTSRHRQDQRGRAPHPGPHRPGVRAPGGRGRQPDHQRLRPRDPRAARATSPTTSTPGGCCAAARASWSAAS